MQNPVESDAGEYVCSVANDDGSISSGSGFITYSKFVFKSFCLSHLGHATFSERI